MTTDFDGKPRFIDGNTDGTQALDIGAFEYGVVLEIAHTGHGATLRWVAAPHETYALEEKTALTGWMLTPNGDTSPFNVDFSLPDRLFRLREAPSGRLLAR